jgi:hypothetical protein
MYTLKSIYHAYFHSVTKYGIILGGNSSYRLENFTLQKKIVRIMAETDWCKQKPAITTKPEVLQASLGPTNLQDNTEPIKNVST